MIYLFSCHAKRHLHWSQHFSKIQNPSMTTFTHDPYFNEAQNRLLTLMNFEESKAGDLPLPEVLVMEDGRPVDSVREWRAGRCPEVLRLFERHLYGERLPFLRPAVEIAERSTDALGGSATRIQVKLRFDRLILELLVYVPNQSPAPAPCFLGLNFHGNHTTVSDGHVPLTSAWVRDGMPGTAQNRSTEAARGTDASRWPVEMIISRGYALATMCYGDVEPDHPNGFQQGVRSLFMPPDGPHDDDSGAIGAWAWGLSRAMDFLENLPGIDPASVCLTGHSRLGKTALWAGACDPRFALVVANNSGCGGGALNRRNFGETLHILSNVRPHWFCGNCRRGSEDARVIPVDQHMLIALCAPRPVLLSCAEDDLPADPRGEFLAARSAWEVYQLFGAGKSPFTDVEPTPNHSILSRIGYHLRPGPHEITAADWRVHLDFADRHLSPEKFLKFRG